SRDRLRSHPAVGSGKQAPLRLRESWCPRSLRPTSRTRGSGRRCRAGRCRRRSASPLSYPPEHRGVQPARRRPRESRAVASSCPLLLTPGDERAIVTRGYKRGQERQACRGLTADAVLVAVEVMSLTSGPLVCGAGLLRV